MGLSTRVSTDLRAVEVNNGPQPTENPIDLDDFSNVDDPEDIQRTLFARAAASTTSNAADASFGGMSVFNMFSTLFPNSKSSSAPPVLHPHDAPPFALCTQKQFPDGVSELTGAPTGFVFPDPMVVQRGSQTRHMWGGDTCSYFLAYRSSRDLVADADIVWVQHESLPGPGNHVVVEQWSAALRSSNLLGNFSYELVLQVYRIQHNFPGGGVSVAQHRARNHDIMKIWEVVDRHFSISSYWSAARDFPEVTEWEPADQEVARQAPPASPRTPVLLPCHTPRSPCQSAVNSGVQRVLNFSDERSLPTRLCGSVLGFLTSSFALISGIFPSFRTLRIIIFAFLTCWLSLAFFNFEGFVRVSIFFMSFVPPFVFGLFPWPTSCGANFRLLGSLTVAYFQCSTGSPEKTLDCVRTVFYTHNIVDAISSAPLGGSSIRHCLDSGA